MDALTRTILAKIRQTTGREYREFEKEVPGMPQEARRALLRLLNDLEGAGQAKARRAALQPWLTP